MLLEVWGGGSFQNLFIKIKSNLYRAPWALGLEVWGPKLVVGVCGGRQEDLDNINLLAHLLQ